MKLCYVSAFLDIGRTSWQFFRRSTEDYIQKFRSNLLYHFDQMNPVFDPDYELILFMDDRYVDEIVPKNSNVKIIPINKDSLIFISPLWKRLPREREIMESSEYRSSFRHRLSFPENSVPEYTLINHAKIDFVVEAQKYSDSPYFCWVDFGYIDIPSSPIDNTLLVDGKVNYNLINPLDDRDRDVLYTMHTAPERIGGGFFWGNKAVLLEYQSLYHHIHERFQKDNLADDDQHLVLRCYYERPSLFHLHSIGGWFRMLNHFRKQDL